MKETDIQRDILTFLDKSGMVCERINSGGYRGRMRGARKGTPDIICAIKGGKWLGIEVKTKDGKASKEQIEYRERLTRVGATYLLATCVEEVQEYLKTV